MTRNESPLTEEELKAKYDLWACTIRQFANKFVWQCVLFVTDSGQLEYGSPVQTRACQSVGIPNEYIEDFWNTAGRDAMEEAIRRKRNTLTNSMKQRFIQYCKNPDRDENEQPLRPPNPLKMIPLGVLQDITNLPETVSVADTGSGDGQGDQESDEEGEENDRMARWVKEGLRDGAGAEEYKHFLLLFAECFSGGGSVAARSSESFKNLSEYMTVTVEAFAIVLYTNNYWKWTKLYWKEGDVSTISEDSRREGALFTNEARGSSKYEGWSSEGYILYNRVFGLLEAQRRDPRSGKRFEDSLRRMFQSRNNGKKRKRSTTVIAIRNGISELDRIMGVSAAAV